jgi:hypothetical protein
MKFFFSMLIAAILMVQSVGAQVRQEMLSMPLGSKNAYMLVLPKCTPKLAEEEWKNFVKQYNKASAAKMKKTDIFLTDNVLVPGISSGNNPIDLYARMDAAGEDTRINLWVDLGGAFVNGADFQLQSEQIEQLLLRFGLQVARTQVQEELKDQEKVLKGLQDDQRKLEKDKKSLEDDIKDYQAKIKKAEENIVKNEDSQRAKQAEIAKQQNVIQAVQERLIKLQ